MMKTRWFEALFSVDFALDPLAPSKNGGQARKTKVAGTKKVFGKVRKRSDYVTRGWV